MIHLEIQIQILPTSQLFFQLKSIKCGYDHLHIKARYKFLQFMYMFIN